MERLSPELLAKLKDAGFVRLTGVPVRDGGGNERPIQPGGPEDMGKWSISHLKQMILVLPGTGDVWSRPGTVPVSQELLDLLCPNGQGTYDPFGPNEAYLYTCRIRRQDDPYCEFGVAQEVAQTA